MPIYSNDVINVDRVSRLYLLSPYDGQNILLRGYYLDGDATPRTLRYDASSSAAVDNGIVFDGVGGDGTGAGTGRFLCESQKSVLYPEWWGCISGDQSVRLKEVMVAAAGKWLDFRGRGVVASVLWDANQGSHSLRIRNGTLSASSISGAAYALKLQAANGSYQSGNIEFEGMSFSGGEWGLWSNRCHFVSAHDCSFGGTVGGAKHEGSYVWRYDRPSFSGPYGVFLYATDTLGYSGLHYFDKANFLNTKINIVADNAKYVEGCYGNTYTDIVAQAPSSLKYWGANTGNRSVPDRWVGTYLELPFTAELNTSDLGVTSVGEVSGSAQAGSTSTTIVLASSASASDDFYNGVVCRYVNHTGRSQGGTSTTITLAASASAVDDYYNGMVVQVVEGSSVEGQARTITDYNGTTKVATVSAWTTSNPGATAQYEIYQDLTITDYVGSTRTATLDGTWLQTPADTDEYRLRGVVSPADGAYLQFHGTCYAEMDSWEGIGVHDYAIVHSNTANFETTSVKKTGYASLTINSQGGYVGNYQGGTSDIVARRIDIHSNTRTASNATWCYKLPWSPDGYDLGTINYFRDPAILTADALETVSGTVTKTIEQHADVVTNVLKCDATGGAILSIEGYDSAANGFDQFVSPSVNGSFIVLNLWVRSDTENAELQIYGQNSGYEGALYLNGTSWTPIVTILKRGEQGAFRLRLATTGVYYVANISATLWNNVDDANLWLRTNKIAGARTSGNHVLTRPTTYAANQQTVTSYSFAATDFGRIVEFNNASPITATVEADSVVNFPIGTQIRVLQTGAGQVTISPDTGVTVNNANGLKTAAQWSEIMLTKRAANTWVVTGDAASNSSRTGGNRGNATN